MKLGYIASNLYRHTFEINEVAELVRRRPDTRVYSFYRPGNGAVQSERLTEIDSPVVSWSPATIVRGMVSLAVRRPFHLLAAAAELGVRSFPNPVYWFKNAATFLAAMPILNDARRHGVTHLHANFGSSPATVAWLGRRILGTGMSLTFHAFDIYYGARSHRDPLKRQKLRDANLVVAVHRHGLDYLRGLVPGEPADKFCVIRISVSFVPLPRRPARPLLVAAGNLIHKKGFDVLVEAVAILARDGTDVRARILGEGPERSRLETLAAAEGVSDRIDMPGYYAHAELAIHLSEASALVMPSRVSAGGQRDGIPTVVVEAWLSRTPVIASLVGGMPEVIVDGDTGLVFEPEDAGALAACVRRLLESDELAITLSAQGTATAETEFSPERNVGKLLEKIESASRPQVPPQVGDDQAGAERKPREVAELDVGEHPADER